ncbi:hypothetical protein CDAR_93251 [Caerostris darwini]|uniref:Uncharacterized protein n=1 Tax=Caerostris darwini TaxID=1538125 RepID=A0AAV4UWC5_9ARAC|nr:hypothetical protein CDAR_93251 [Caerostris darwini]
MPRRRKRQDKERTHPSGNMTWNILRQQLRGKNGRKSESSIIRPAVRDGLAAGFSSRLSASRRRPHRTPDSRHPSSQQLLRLQRRTDSIVWARSSGAGTCIKGE